MIEVTEVYKYYGPKRALGPITFSVEQGEIVGLLGLNGAGKTTTLRILAGDLLATSGSVSIGGTALEADQDAVRARIGYLPDVPPLYGEMTVREYLVFAARLRGLTGKVAIGRAKEVEALTEIGDVSGDPIASLSHGFRQRVGIAQAIVHQPALVLLDEPISGLDPVQIVEMRRLVRSLRGEHTVVISSHILTEISETCDTLLVLRDGEIVAKGSEKELSERLVGGCRIDMTVRQPEGLTAGATALIKELPGVQEVSVVSPQEPGTDELWLRVVSSSDIRETACRTLVEKGFGILELRRTHRELEALFLEVSGAASSESGDEEHDFSEGESTEGET